MCLWLQWLDKQDAYMKMNVIRLCTLCSCLLAVIRFDLMLSHKTWQPASGQGNTLAAFKDSIYRPVTTQNILQFLEMKKELLDSAEGMEILEQNSVVGFTLWPCLAILSNQRSLCGQQTSFWGHSDISFSYDNWQLLIRSHLSPNWGLKWFDNL